MVGGGMKVRSARKNGVRPPADVPGVRPPADVPAKHRGRARAILDPAQTDGQWSRRKFGVFVFASL